MVNGHSSGSSGTVRFSAAGTVSSCPAEKEKTLCLFCKRQSVLKTLCGTTLGCRPLTEGGRSQPAAQADGITPVTRPRLLASSFSRRLQGDFHAPSLSAFHRHGGSLCRFRCATRPYLRHCIRLPDHHIMFCGFVNRWRENFLLFPAESRLTPPPASPLPGAASRRRPHFPGKSRRGSRGTCCPGRSATRGCRGRSGPARWPFSHPGRRCRWCWR